MREVRQAVDRRALVRQGVLIAPQMVIKASAAAEVRALVDALSGTDEVQREAAVARLAVIGPRAIERLTDAYRTSRSRDTHVAILRALEAISHHRSAPIARAAILEGGDVGVAATAVLRPLLSSPHGSTAADALDALMAVALDSKAERRLRLAALDALQDMPEPVRARVAEALRDDPVTRLQGDAARIEAIWTDAADGRLPDHPALLRDALASRASTAPLNTLRQMIDVIRAHERASDAGQRDSWRSVRGALHQALALRGSRVALYDLRESLGELSATSGAPPSALPVSFLAALHVLGDASCVEPIAAAWVRSGPDDEPWRTQLASAFRAIVRRQKITRRHAVLKRILSRWPEAAPLAGGR
jgi:hypothetical protein